MLEELRHAEACVFLHNLSKYHPEEWFLVKHKLIDGTQDLSSLSILAVILQCSAREDLSSCDWLIPGLSVYSSQFKKEPQELFD